MSLFSAHKIFITVS